MERTDLDEIERRLIEARDALIAYWEQPEGQVCLLALRLAEDTLSDYHALDWRASHTRDPEAWQRVTALADEILRLQAPLEGAL